MNQLLPVQHATLIHAQVKCSGRSFPVSVTRISCDGCTVEAGDDWAADFDFLSLTLAGEVAVNGRVVRREGRRADIAFYGEIHPHVVAQWCQRAA